MKEGNRERDLKRETQKEKVGEKETAKPLTGFPGGPVTPSKPGSPGGPGSPFGPCGPGSPGSPC